MANKYILKAIDENDDELSSTLTYEFTADNLDVVLDHFVRFLQGSGYSYVESLDAITDSDIYIRKDNVVAEENQNKASDLDSVMAKTSY